MTSEKTTKNITAEEEDFEFSSFFKDEERKVLFKIPTDEKIRLLARLENDGVNMTTFFKAVIKSYVNLDDDFYQWWERRLPEVSSLSKKNIQKTLSVRRQGQENFEQWKVSDEISSIFKEKAKEFTDI